MSYDEEGWTFVTRKRLCKNKCLIHTLTFLRGDDMSGILVNIWKRKKEKILKENKWLIIQIEDLLVQKLITLITIGEYFTLGFFDKMVTISTHMVSCNETSKEEGLSEDEENILGVESRKTKEEEGIVASLQHLPLLFTSHEMSQLPNEMWNALIQVLKNPTLYATKIKRTKRLGDESHSCAKCCATITFIDEDL